MTTMNKSLIAAALFALPAGSVLAEPTSPVVSASATIDIGVSKTAAISMTPLGPFPESIVRQVITVAEGEASSSDAKVAIRWGKTPNINVDSVLANSAVVTGAGGEKGYFVLRGAHGSLSGDTSTDDGWYVAKENPTKFTVHTNGNMTVNADSYPITIEAVAWNT